MRGAAGVSVAEIDDQLRAEDLEAIEAQLRARPANPSDDQATRLRSLFRESQAAPAPVPRVSVETAGVGPTFAAVPTRRDAARRARVVTIASGKGGVGKTNIAVNLCVALARGGLRVTLLDADLGTANADLLCGVLPAGRLHHALNPGSPEVQDAGRRSVRELAVDVPGGFRLVPGSTGVARMADLSAGERRRLIAGLKELERDADVVVVDAAAGIGLGVTSFMAAADLSILITTPEPTALADAYALAKCVALGGGEAGAAFRDGRLGVVVNQVADPLEALGVHARFAKVCRRFLGVEATLLGFVAQDVHVAQAVRAQQPLLVRSPKCEAALNMWELGRTVADTLGVRGVRGSSGGEAAAGRGLSVLVRRLLGR